MSSLLLALAKPAVGLLAGLSLFAAKSMSVEIDQLEAAEEARRPQPEQHEHKAAPREAPAAPRKP